MPLALVKKGAFGEGYLVKAAGDMSLNSFVA